MFGKSCVFTQGFFFKECLSAFAGGRASCGCEFSLSGAGVDVFRFVFYAGFREVMLNVLSKNSTKASSQISITDSVSGLQKILRRYIFFQNIFYPGLIVIT